VFIAFLLLALLIGAAPIMLFFESPLVTGLAAAVLAAAMAIVAKGIRPGESGHLQALVRPVAIVAAVPAVWLAIQVLPLGRIGLAHPIWSNAEVALGRPAWGSISVDIGATLVSLCRYLCAIAVLFLTVAVAIDRRRAEWLLFVLVGTTVAIAAMAIAQHFGGLTFLDVGHGTTLGAQAMDCTALGVILSAVCVLRALERRELHGAKPSASALDLVLCVVALVGCLAALAWSATGVFLVAVGYGLAAMAAVVVIRWFGLGAWGCAAIAAAVLVVTIAIVANQPGSPAANVTLAFATDAPPALLAVTQRILADVPWAGTGGGTFAALLPTYRDTGDVLIGAAAPTSAAAVEVELGRSMLVAIVVTAVAAAAASLRAALRRGRDSFYAAAGAGCLVAVLILGFTNAGVFAMAPSLVLAAVLGLAVAQSKSRRVQ
jgi:hypothetical protein